MWAPLRRHPARPDPVANTFPTPLHDSAVQSCNVLPKDLPNALRKGVLTHWGDFWKPIPHALGFHQSTCVSTLGDPQGGEGAGLMSTSAALERADDPWGFKDPA